MARVDAKLLQIMPKLQILLDKGKVDFMTSLRCLYCWKAEVLLFETIGQRGDVMKSKMAAREI